MRSQKDIFCIFLTPSGGLLKWGLGLSYVELLEAKASTWDIVFGTHNSFGRAEPITGPRQ